MRRKGVVVAGLGGEDAADDRRDDHGQAEREDEDTVESRAETPLMAWNQMGMK